MPLCEAARADCSTSLLGFSNHFSYPPRSDMMEIYRASPLFDQNLLFLISQDGTKQRMCLRVIPGQRTFPFSDITEHLIHVEVTDDLDPYFLYTLDVGETDYHQLKHDQSLVVNFDIFPSKLIDLIDLCVSSQTSSSFNVHLDKHTGILSVSETNGFKQLTHLSLHLRQGNDTAIKSYLASRLALTTSIAGRYARDLEHALSELEDEKANMRIHTDYLTEIEQERVRHEQLVGDLRMQCQSSANDAHDARQQMNELSENYNQARVRIEELVSQLGNANENQLTLENNETTAKSEHLRLTMENNHLQSQIVELEAKIESLTRQVNDQSAAMTESALLQQAGEDVRQILEEKLQCMHNNLTALREASEANSDGSALAEVLQEQIKQLGEKLQQKEIFINQQERLVAELQKHIEEMESCDSVEQEQGKTSSSPPITNNHDSNNERYHASLSNYALKCQVSSLQQQLSDAVDRLKASDLVIAGNHEAIAYLNEEINKWKIGIKSHRTDSPIAMAINNSGGTRVEVENASVSNNVLDSPCSDTLREIVRNSSPFRGYPPPTIADDEIYGEGAKTANAYLQTVSRTLNSTNNTYSAPSSSHTVPSEPPLQQPLQSSLYLSSDIGDDDYDTTFSVLYPLSATEVMNRKLNRWSQAHSFISSSSDGEGGVSLAAQGEMLLAGLADDLEALDYYKTGRKTGSKNVMAIEEQGAHGGLGNRSGSNRSSGIGGGNDKSSSGFGRNHAQGTGCPRIPYTWQSVDLHTTME